MTGRTAPGGPRAGTASALERYASSGSGPSRGSPRHSGRSSSSSNGTLGSAVRAAWPAHEGVAGGAGGAPRRGSDEIAVCARAARHPQPAAPGALATAENPLLSTAGSPSPRKPRGSRAKISGARADVAPARRREPFVGAAGSQASSVASTGAAAAASDGPHPRPAGPAAALLAPGWLPVQARATSAAAATPDYVSAVEACGGHDGQSDGPTSTRRRPQHGPPLMPTLAPAQPLEAPRLPPLLTLAIDLDALFCGPATQPRPTAALAVLRALLRCNVAAPARAPVDVVLCGGGSMKQRRAWLATLQEQRIDVERLVLGRAPPPRSVLPALAADLVLCGAAAPAVAAAVGTTPAAQVLLPGPAAGPLTGLRVAFDFDGVLADRASQRHFERHGLAAFQAHEERLGAVPLAAGPLLGFARALQAVREEVPQAGIALYVITSRGGAAVQRVHASLDAWRLDPDLVVCLGGRPKAATVAALAPALFFDDDITHLGAEVRAHTLALHVPFAA